MPIFRVLRACVLSCVESRCVESTTQPGFRGGAVWCLCLVCFEFGCFEEYASHSEDAGIARKRMFNGRCVHMYTYAYLGVYLKSHNCGFVAVLLVFSMLFIIYVYYVYYVYLKYYLYIDIFIYK